ncbi:RrF2 family transcriptional regulator [Amycolatopsis pittospori]|uniref:RrF2 family transcriptional regulator n=1 Tax=Amycolatopsis pittospori TaxID=2749434 RepID=UPI001F2EDAD3|nr:Rrf2 family transcriptional regulator [Amycolatopsis pittospori]
MSEGVEWALHCCLDLTWLDPGTAAPAAKLAAFHGLPTAYLNKQLQALARDGIVTSTRGPRGGFRLARGPERITLMDVVTAIEGAEQAFRCTEIRGPSPKDPARDVYREPCLIDQAMRKAELAWRVELAGQTVADIKVQVERNAPDVPEHTRRWFADVQA